MATMAKGQFTPRDIDHTFSNILKRCVQCPPTTPVCPDTCPGGKVCSLIPQNCNQCARVECISNPNAPQTHGPNVAAIAGGVVGGVAFVVIAVLCVYFVWIKKRRAEQDAELEEDWIHDEISSTKRSTRFTTIGDAASTRTRGSLAASILSRASNIIQIAYIPGVTNRNGSSHNSIHAPVPPIPAAHRTQPPKSPLSQEGDMLFFRPGDLRDSTWSGTSSINSADKRDTRYTMASISPSLMRDSIASEIFMDDASAQPMPATAAARLAPRMVSVKSTPSANSLSDASNGSSSPHPEGAKPKGLQVMMPAQAGLSPNSSIRSAGKAKQVTVPGTKGRFPVRQPSDASTATSKHAPNVSSPLAGADESKELGEGSSLMMNMDFATPPAIQPVESPFFDASERPTAASSLSRPNPYASMASSIDTRFDGPSKPRGKSIGGLSAVEEEAIKRASRTSEMLEDETKAGKSTDSPFSDAHATE